MWQYPLRNLPRSLKLLVGSFLMTMLFGYGASFVILSSETGITPDKIEETYIGNEHDENADQLKFRKSKFELLTTVHSHVFTLGAIFLLTGTLMYFTRVHSLLKTFLMVEPPLSLIVSFGSMILMWWGITEFKYLVVLSGGLMHGSFLLSILLLLWEISRKAEDIIP